MQIFPEILLFVFKIAMIDVLFLLLSIWKQASPWIKFDMVG